MIALTIAACASNVEHVDLLVENVTVYRSDGTAPYMGAIAVRDGKFVFAAPPDGTKFIAAQKIDGTDKFATPGLWDAHTHVRSSENGGIDGARFLQYGVTSIHDLGGKTDRIKDLEKEIAQDPLKGPSLYPVYFMINGESFAPFQRAVSTEQGALAALDELAAAGAVRIKIHRALSPDLALFVFSEAERRGLKVTGHIPLGLDPLKACEAGMKGIEHIGSFVEAFVSIADEGRKTAQAGLDFMLSAEADPLYKCLVENNVAVTPTLVVYPAIAKSRAAGGEIPQEFKDFIRRTNAIAKRLYDEGVLILSGTDVSDLDGPFMLEAGLSLHEELRIMEASGVPARALIQIAAFNPARAVDADAKTGSIAVEKDADFLILSEDPGETIANLRAIEAVFKQGRLVDEGVK